MSRSTFSRDRFQVLRLGGTFLHFLLSFAILGSIWVPVGAHLGTCGRPFGSQRFGPISEEKLPLLFGGSAAEAVPPVPAEHAGSARTRGSLITPCAPCGVRRIS